MLSFILKAYSFNRKYTLYFVEVKICRDSRWGAHAHAYPCPLHIDMNERVSAGGQVTGVCDLKELKVQV